MDFVNKNIKYIGLAGCALMIVGAFLSFATVTVSVFGISSSASFSYMDENGIYLIILAILSGVMLFVKNFGILNNLRINGINFQKYLQYWWGPIVPVAVAVALVIYDAVTVGSAAAVSNAAYGGLASADISLGLGFYVIILGAIVNAGSVIYEKFVMKVDNSATSAPVASTTQYTTEQQPVQQSAAVNCPGCGTQMPNGTKFCTNCGTQLQ